jgi:trans-aconitate methyltransferase
LSDTYQVTGSDDSQEFLNHLQQTYPRGEFLNIDAATIVTDKKFHGIYSNKVLHHLKNEELISSVQKQSDVLHADGIVCHSFWKGK